MIKLLVSIAGEDFAYSTGETVDLKDKEWERRLVDSGQAEPVEKPARRKKPTLKE